MGVATNGGLGKTTLQGGVQYQALQGDLAKEMPRTGVPDGVNTSCIKNWDVDCVLKILCAQDMDVVEELARSTVVVIDSMTFPGFEFHNGKWLPIAPMPGDGDSIPEEKRITLFRNEPCRNIVSTIYHEIRHQNQPRGWSRYCHEFDAYKETEQWTIDRGLPSQEPDADPPLREPAPGDAFAEVPSPSGIQKFIYEKYGLSPDHPNGFGPAGGPSIPKNGDRYYDFEHPDLSHPQPLDPSVWKCPCGSTPDKGPTTPAYPSSSPRDSGF
jgi:hypothetical protein